MTPPLRWVFLLALVGCAASIPLVDDACVLLCHPRARSSPEGVCELRGAQSGSVLDLARIIVSHCLKLCDRQLQSSVRDSCFALRSFFGAYRGCRCRSTPVMPTNVKIRSLVNELAEDVAFSSPLGELVISALHAALLREDADAEGYDLIVDDRESGGRLAHDAENEKPRRHVLEQPPVDNGYGHGRVRPQGGDRTDNTAASDSLDEDDDNVDWELWCMEQCNSGQGGDACRCDIVP
ncbi:PREDICTED: uncharacterized protein LOC106743869 [Dinoponera quadriceps]|uniref:Uncharacterized protein LOC106743869 n=1 Tax=Dinoponera quadriceps TaxID=609295 RepID=A0A6P3X5G0_DINQU|nr:PREDICTED: uncharacterized protein LOC106743869 [Dinoponera quadriceps]